MDTGWCKSAGAGFRVALQTTVWRSEFGIVGLNRARFGASAFFQVCFVYVGCTYNMPSFLLVVYFTFILLFLVFWSFVVWMLPGSICCVFCVAIRMRPPRFLLQLVYAMLYTWCLPEYTLLAIFEV